MMNKAIGGVEMQGQYVEKAFGMMTRVTRPQEPCKGVPTEERTQMKTAILLSMQFLPEVLSIFLKRRSKLTAFTCSGSEKD
jgi:hypothetical protein